MVERRARERVRRVRRIFSSVGVGGKVVSCVRFDGYVKNSAE